ncbi:hypothetical protein [Maricaulis sp.]|uniref:hypothetical protein n=1 Tax=Maricaulis sp. TaxID=1486257 RepID=UPI001B1DD01A|nr:hypothetical protein [Maricaulis sp.]MBO6763375.1 hypothetical protein [Maricaulis sp.]
MLGLIALLALGAPPAEPLALYARARATIETHGDTLWPGFADAPFRMLLNDGEREFLVCGDTPDGFEPAGTDPVTGCSLAARDARFGPNLLATFPLFGVSTIVIGTPEETGQSPRAWQQTVLHEHMHQFQDTHPAASYAAVQALDLHGGDETGMWMLNYPFAYDDPATAEAGRALADAALAALDAEPDGFDAAFDAYAAARAAFIARLSDADHRYYEFQVWKEGVARWAELALARLADDSDETARQEARLRQELRELSLPDWQRVAFYALGSADAELLERRGAAWREAYFDYPFRLDTHFVSAGAR